MANKPGLTARVWRYMPFDRFSDLVTTGELYLRRLDHLETYDAYEGRWLKGVEDLRFTEGVDDPASLIAALDRERTRTFVSCWSSRVNERQDMWDRLKPSDEAVAVVAVYADLIEALAANALSLAIGGVCYLDALAEFVERFQRVNTYNLPFCKRNDFRHEQEVRVVYQDHGTGELENHVRATINLDRLLPRVVLSPGSDGALADKVHEALASMGFQFEVLASSL